MYVGLKRIDYRLVGWSWMMWDFNWFRKRTADAVVNRIRGRISNGDIVVLHDGDESAPLADQRHTVDATARLIPDLRARGFSFGVVCENDDEPESGNRVIEQFNYPITRLPNYQILTRILP